MNKIFKKALFAKHILVNEETLASRRNYDPENRLAILVSLGRKFGIRIIEHPELASIEMLHDAAEELGENVPEPFYRGFPRTVWELTPDQLLFDQLYHYTMTYGLGWFDHPGHSTMESEVMKKFEEAAYEEKAVLKDFRILSEEDAIVEVINLIHSLLEGNRPLNRDQFELVLQGWKSIGPEILPEKVPCKDTIIRLLIETKHIGLCRYLVLSDVIKLLNAIQYEHYRSENLKKLNLKNQDRKLITAVINWFFENDLAVKYENHYLDIYTCHEKRKIWCGLLHHIHYKPNTDSAIFFVQGIRSGKNQSNLAIVEKHLRNGQPVWAAKHLVVTKGSSALLRNLNYILSRCTTDDEIKEVLSCLEKI